MRNGCSSFLFKLTESGVNDQAVYRFSRLAMHGPGLGLGCQQEKTDEIEKVGKHSILQ